MAKPTSTVPSNAVIFRNKLPGMAIPGYFASTAFIESDEAYSQISGRSFGWYDFEDQCQYKGDKSEFRRPTQEEWDALFTEEMKAEFK